MSSSTGYGDVDSTGGTAWVHEHGAHLVDYASYRVPPARAVTAVASALRACAIGNPPENITDRAWLLSAVRRECAAEPNNPSAGFHVEPGPGPPDGVAVRNAWTLVGLAEAEALRLLYRHELSLDDLAYVVALPSREVSKLITRTQDMVEILVSGLDSLARGRPICHELAPMVAVVFPDDRDGRVSSDAARSALLTHIVTCQVCKRPINIRYTVPRILSHPPISALTDEIRSQLLDAIRPESRPTPAYRPPASFGMPLPAPITAGSDLATPPETVGSSHTRLETAKSSRTQPETVRSPSTETVGSPHTRSEEVRPSSTGPETVKSPATRPETVGPAHARPETAGSPSAETVGSSGTRPENVRPSSVETARPPLSQPDTGRADVARGGSAQPAALAPEPAASQPAAGQPAAGQPIQPESNRELSGPTGASPTWSWGTEQGQDTPLYNALLSQIQARETRARAEQAAGSSVSSLSNASASSRPLAGSDSAPDRNGRGQYRSDYAPYRSGFDRYAAEPQGARRREPYGVREKPQPVPVAGAGPQIRTVLVEIGSLIRATAIRLLIVIVAGAAGTVAGINLLAPAPERPPGSRVSYASGSTVAPGRTATAGTAAPLTSTTDQPGGGTAVGTVVAGGIRLWSTVALDDFGQGSITLEAIAATAVKWRLSAEGLALTPSSGVLKPGETAVVSIRALRVRYWCGVPPSVTAPLVVHTPNDSGTATVRWRTC